MSGSGGSSNDRDDKPSSSSSSSSWWPFSSSSSASSSWQEQWEEFHDGQRLERLSTCLQLDDILKQCRRQRKFRQRDESDNDVDPLETISPGLRTMKYYGWRGILTKLKKSTSSDNDDKRDDGDGDHDTRHQTQPDPAFNKALHDQIQSSCSREQHAVWACRAVATGCGKELAHLKKCFEDDYPNEQEMILVVPHTAYDNSNSAKDNNNKKGTARSSIIIPCYEAQQRLGACVTANATSLLERKQKREAAAAATAALSKP